MFPGKRFTLGDGREYVIPPLTAEQRAVVAQNLGLVGAVLRDHCGLAGAARALGFEKGDLLSIGTLGLIRAVARFDPGRGVGLASYAIPWIRQAIGRALDTEGRAIRLPLVSGRQRVQSPKFREAAALARQPVVSLDEPVKLDGDRDATLGDLIADPATGEDATVDAITANERTAELEHVLAAVPFASRERAVLALRFSRELTLEETGRALGVTRQCAQQAEARALSRIRRDRATMRRLARLRPAA